MKTNETNNSAQQRLDTLEQSKRTYIQIIEQSREYLNDASLPTPYDVFDQENEITENDFYCYAQASNININMGLLLEHVKSYAQKMNVDIEQVSLGVYYACANSYSGADPHYIISFFHPCKRPREEVETILKYKIIDAEDRLDYILKEMTRIHAHKNLIDEAAAKLQQYQQIQKELGKLDIIV